MKTYCVGDFEMPVPNIMYKKIRHNNEASHHNKFLLPIYTNCHDKVTKKRCHQHHCNGQAIIYKDN